MTSTTVIVGAGDFGMRLASLRAQAGDSVICMRRRSIPMPEGVQAVAGDLFDEKSYAGIASAPDWLVYCATPDTRTESSYRRVYIEGLALAQARLLPKRTLLISSTAVYAQNAGEWVDADSPAEADTFNGSVLREAEQHCLQSPSNRVLRLSGLCGPGRTQLVRKALLGEGLANVWSNRIHIDDAASAASHLLAKPGKDLIWVGSDDLPSLQLDVVNWIRKRHQLPALPAFSSMPTGRKVSNAKLKAAGWLPQYPSYREIYGF